MVDRVATGIYGLDEMIEGGFPRGRAILVSGGCGTGKTIFNMQYLYRGAMEYGEPGIAVVLDERPEMLREDMKRFGWDLERAENKGLLALVDASSARVGFPSEEKYAMPPMGVDIDRLLLKVMQVADQIGAKRIGIDSLAGLGLHLEKESGMRKAILKINYMLMRTKLTGILTSEIPEQSFGAGPSVFSKYGVEEYVADGVIILHYLGIGTETNRNLFVRKMRGTKHIEDIMPMEITNKGIVLKKLEEAYKTV